MPHLSIKINNDIDHFTTLKMIAPAEFQGSNLNIQHDLKRERIIPWTQLYFLPIWETRPLWHFAAPEPPKNASELESRFEAIWRRPPASISRGPTAIGNPPDIW
jgi:hypothetical protein